MSITVPAAKSMQGNLVLYSTSIKVKNLVEPGFYSIEKLDPDNKTETGYQRVLNTARARKLADYILKGQENKDAFLPTSILLATDKDIHLNESENTITISKETEPFSVVDGQHRLEGLRMAAEKNHDILDFQVPVNIATKLDKISQMCHFLIVNTTQKSVDKGVEQRIYARLTEMVVTEHIPSLPKWIQTIINRGEIDKALKIVDYLNTEENSPWNGKIQIADHIKKGTTIKQGSFVTLLKRNFLVANNPLLALGDSEIEKKIFLNYWKAICDLLDDNSDTVLYKYNGVDLFCKFSIPFFHKLMAADPNAFQVDRMKGELERCFESMEGDYAGVGYPEWWHKGGIAGGMNASALTKVVQAMAHALNRRNMTSGEITI
ncbi:MAG: DGQHR domain-containing protein [Gammaproteobacteria bacterium]|nr:DGQHR domain-containing protein [Gammaproteobacteria bacterium]